MKQGALGDVHGDFASVRAIMARHPDVAWWITVGDLADGRGAYEAPPVLLHWIKGNNDNLEVITELAAGRRRMPNLRYLPNGVPVKLGDTSVLGLGGTFAPTWYKRLPGDLPRPRLGPASQGEFPRPARDDKRRHFLHVEVEACKRLRNVDPFLSHEAARPFYLDVRGRRQVGGKTPINEVLAALRPRTFINNVIRLKGKSPLRWYWEPAGAKVPNNDIDWPPIEDLRIKNAALIGDDGEPVGDLNCYSNYAERWDMTGWGRTTAVDEHDYSLPDVFSLEQNFPNPFNPETMIKYNLTRTGNVTLTIFNVLGEKITTLVRDIQDAGAHSIRWDGRNSAGQTLGSGLYLYQLRMDSQVITKKMMLLK